MLINSSYFTFFKLKKNKKILWHFEGEKFEWFGYISKEEEEKILPWMVSSAKKKENEKFILFLLTSFVLDFFIHSIIHYEYLLSEFDAWQAIARNKKWNPIHTPKKIYSYFPVP